MAIGTILAVGATLASLTGSGLSAAAGQKAKRAQDRAYSANMADINSQINQRVTDRADMQALLTQMRALNQERADAAAARQAVGGGTDAAVAAEKASAAQQEARVLSDAAVANMQRQDALQAELRAERSNYSQLVAGRELQRAANIANAASTAMSAAQAGISSDSAWARGAKEPPTFETIKTQDIKTPGVIGGNNPTDLSSAWSRGVASKIAGTTLPGTYKLKSL